MIKTLVVPLFWYYSWVDPLAALESKADLRPGVHLLAENVCVPWARHEKWIGRAFCADIRFRLNINGFSACDGECSPHVIVFVNPAYDVLEFGTCALECEPNFNFKSWTLSGVLDRYECPRNLPVIGFNKTHRGDAQVSPDLRLADVSGVFGHLLSSDKRITSYVQSAPDQDDRKGRYSYARDAYPEEPKGPVVHVLLGG